MMTNPYITIGCKAAIVWIEWIWMDSCVQYPWRKPAVHIVEKQTNRSSPVTEGQVSHFESHISCPPPCPCPASLGPVTKIATTMTQMQVSARSLWDVPAKSIGRNGFHQPNTGEDGWHGETREIYSMNQFWDMVFHCTCTEDLGSLQRKATTQWSTRKQRLPILHKKW